jgi:hypothetical protein
MDRPRPTRRKLAWRAWLSPQLLLMTAFWMYVALSNVLYAGSMQATMTAMNIHGFFAAPDARLLQHAILYPLFLGCVWAALAIGWKPRTVPLQVLLALVFSVLANPAMQLSLSLLEKQADSHGAMSMGTWSMHGMDFMWVASATTFMCNYGFGLALATGFAFYRRLADSELRSAALERELSAAQLSALRMQLSPHTLFNLLHTIRGHIVWNPAQAQAMVVQLGDLLRGLLAAGTRELTPLGVEMQFVRLYLGLQQKRFADRLTVHVPSPEGLARAWVPSLILQPLVENAVVHGLAGHDGRVSIRVEALVREETLLLRVTNTLGARPKAGGAGIGLANVRERLAIQFGVRASLHAVAGLDQVWLAEVRMPLLRDGPTAVSPASCTQEPGAS